MTKLYKGKKIEDLSNDEFLKWKEQEKKDMAESNTDIDTEPKQTMGDFVSNIFELPKLDELFKDNDKISVFVDYVKFENTGFGEQMILSINTKEYHTSSKTLIQQIHQALTLCRTPIMTHMARKTGGKGDYYTLIPSKKD